MTILEDIMRIALEEAKQSLREGNHGFGAVIFKEHAIIAQAHDKEESIQDPTSHAELNAIRNASKILGKNLAGCTIVSTHEPCPMCSSAIVWSGIDTVVYGYSIEESLKQDRKRINLTCAEIFHRAGKDIQIIPNILFNECKLLYDKNVRAEVKKLRGITKEGLIKYNEESMQRRLQWFEENKASFTGDSIQNAYALLLCRLNISPNEAPIIHHENTTLIFHSMNFCPTLEACKILKLDTRFICKWYNEKATDALIKRIDPKLKFMRNYEKLRPYSEYCEEMIIKE
jgi:tRNA(adenine34) deaminase